MARHPLPHHHRITEALATLSAAAVLLAVVAITNQPAAADVRDPGAVPTAAPCSGGERAGCPPVPTVIVTPEPRPDGGPAPTATPCSGGERAGCVRAPAGSGAATAGEVL